MLIQYFRSCPPYLEAVSSIRNLRMTRHAVVTGEPLNMAAIDTSSLNKKAAITIPVHVF
jgi:hypothetical protein